VWTCWCIRRATVQLGPVGSTSIDDLDRQYRLNLRAPYLLTQCLLPLLTAAKGQVVFVNSQAGLTAAPT
jgi:NAD(P)-dependent dehydrogenase (short-subunit alcohol dehydrogenase family)